MTNPPESVQVTPEESLPLRYVTSVTFGCRPNLYHFFYEGPASDPKFQTAVIERVNSYMVDLNLEKSNDVHPKGRDMLISMNLIYERPAVLRALRNTYMALRKAPCEHGTAVEALHEYLISDDESIDIAENITPVDSEGIFADYLEAALRG